MYIIVIALPSAVIGLLQQRHTLKAVAILKYCYDAHCEIITAN